MMDLNPVTKIVDIEGEAFPVVDVGSGPAVLLLHGFPDSRFLWRYQVPALVEAGFRVIAPDLRGFGEAPRPIEVRPYRVSVQAGGGHERQVMSGEGQDDLVPTCLEGASKTEVWIQVSKGPE